MAIRAAWAVMHQALEIDDRRLEAIYRASQIKIRADQRKAENSKRRPVFMLGYAKWEDEEGSES